MSTMKSIWTIRNRSRNCGYFLSFFPCLFIHSFVVVVVDSFNAAAVRKTQNEKLKTNERTEDWVKQQQQQKYLYTHVRHAHAHDHLQ